MTLSPRTIRLDLKCGQGSISQGEKCTKGTPTPTESAQKRKSRKAQRWVNAAQTLGTMGAIGITAGLLIHTASQASYGVGVIHGFRQGRLANLNANQRSVARSRQQTLSSIRERASWAPPATNQQQRPPASYRPQTEREHQVNVAWTTPVPPSVVTPKTSPEYDVSAAFAPIKRKKRKRPKSSNINPDVSSAWKRDTSVTFYPTTYVDPALQ